MFLELTPSNLIIFLSNDTISMTAATDCNYLIWFTTSRFHVSDSALSSLHVMILLMILLSYKPCRK